MRLPLAEAAGVLAKLCGASSMAWADLVAMYGDGASGDAGVGGMMAYLRKHDLTAKLNAAVNEVALTLTLTPTPTLTPALTLALTIRCVPMVAPRSSRCARASA